MQKIITQQVKFNDGPGRIHAISTGSVSVKRNFKNAKGGNTLSKLNFMLDETYTDPLPIWVWVIEHPEGIFLIDTGENANVNDAGYFKKEGPFLNWINTTQFKFQVLPEEEIGMQLAKINLTPQAIDTVVLTHLHLDHIDGLKYFKNSEIIVNEYEWRHPSFALPSLYPKWFDPKHVKLQNPGQSPFSKEHSLTRANDVVLVATPGHTKGHCSVLAMTDTVSYFFAGDVTYDQQQLKEEKFAGAHQDFKLARNTYACIKRYAAKNNTLYLPSHDPGNPGRIVNQEFFK